MRRDQKADVGATVSDFVGWHGHLWMSCPPFPSQQNSQPLPASSGGFWDLDSCCPFLAQAAVTQDV